MADRNPEVAVTPDTKANAIQRWTTEGVDSAKRLDLYAEALHTAVDPMRVVSRNDGRFHARVEAVSLGPVSLIQAVGGAHRCVRDERDVAATEGRSIHLILNTSSAWRLRHRGEQVMRRGDVVLLDSDLGHDIDLGEFAITHLKLAEPWLRQWVPSTQALAGCVVPHDTGWGQALTGFVRQLTPDFVARAPVPGHLLAEHLGVLLALVASETGAAPGPCAAPRTRGPADRIREMIVQRCTEPALAATDVARSLSLSTRTLHRTLASRGDSFASLLMAARVKVAIRLLESPLMDGLTTAEVGHRCGFLDASHFARVIHARRGCTPRQIRLQRD
jgi:AraC-like DNA-binding protein